MEEIDIGQNFLTNFISNILAVTTPSKEPEIMNSKMSESILKIEKPELIEHPQIIKPIQQEIKPSTIEPIQTPSFNGVSLSPSEKINYLVKDPYVNEIECVGSNEPLFVRKSGVKQRTNIRLSIEEIYELIAEFSQKTRIPVINGTIKAALNDLVISGFLSDPRGPRFTIHKKRHDLKLNF